nr:MAG TPA: hypothetical protein [Caudoviricetes sp.]
MDGWTVGRGLKCRDYGRLWAFGGGLGRYGWS